MTRKPLTETIRCPECSGEPWDAQCMCRGARRITRIVVCACCYANHRAADCPYFCPQCECHHEHGEHAA